MIVCLTPSKSDTGFGLSFRTASKAFSSLREEKNTSAANTYKTAISKSRATAPPLAPISTCLTHFASFITTLLLVLILSHLTPTTEAVQPEVRIKAVTYDWLCVLDINCTHQHPVHLSWKGYDYKTNHLSIKANSDMSEEPVVCSTYDHPRETTTVDIRDHCNFPPTVRYMLKKVLPIYFTFLSGVILCLVFPAARYPSLLSALPVAMASTTSSIATDVSTLSNHSSQQSTTEHPTTANSQPYTAVEKTLLALIPILIACIVMVLVFTFLLKKKQKEVNDAGVYPIYRPRRSSSMSKLTLITLVCLVACAHATVDKQFVHIDVLNDQLLLLNNTGMDCQRSLWSKIQRYYGAYSLGQRYAIKDKSPPHVQIFKHGENNVQITSNFSLLFNKTTYDNTGHYEFQCDSDTISSLYYNVTVYPDISNSTLRIVSAIYNGTLCNVYVRCGEPVYSVKTTLSYDGKNFSLNEMNVEFNSSKSLNLTCTIETKLQKTSQTIEISRFCRRPRFDASYAESAASTKGFVVFGVTATIGVIFLIAIIIAMKPKLCFASPVYAVVLSSVGTEAANLNCTNSFDQKNDYMYIMVIILATLTCISLIVGILKIIFLCLFRCPGKYFDDDDV